MKKTKRKAFFSLVELLIVIAILGVLLSLLMPALKDGIFTARLVECGTKLKNIGSMVYIYANDFDDFYPSHETSTGSSGRGGTIISPGSQNNAAYNTFGSYFDGEYGDHYELTVANPTWQCPQGTLEVPWYNDTSWTNTHSRNKGYFSVYFDLNGGVQAGRYMKRLGDVFVNTRVNSTWGPSGLEWNIILSDHVDSGNGLTTNHIWGGNRTQQIHFTHPPLYIYTNTGIGKANYLFDDLSMRMLQDILPVNMSSQFIAPSVSSAGNPYLLPRGWDKK